MHLANIVAAGLVPGMALALARRAVECDYETTASSGETCYSFASSWGLSVDTLQQLNPGINCPELETSKSYCVIGAVIEDPDQPSTAPTTTTHTITTKTTTITTTTPSKYPTMPGIAGDCDAFHKISSGDQCSTIAARYSTSVDQLKGWNSEIKEGGLIGASLNGDYFEPWDSADPRDHETAERRMEDYPAEMRAQLSHRLLTFTEAEFALLREAKVDFYGMNYYTAQFARHREYPEPDTDYLGNIDEHQEDKNGISIGELSGIDWLRVASRYFRKHLVRIYNRYKKPIYVTENGCPCPGE
ncbi:glycoside hydrolase superfamily [Aspergillus terricola var. indicus]